MNREIESLKEKLSKNLLLTNDELIVLLENFMDQF